MQVERKTNYLRSNKYIPVDFRMNKRFTIKCLPVHHIFTAGDTECRTASKYIRFDVKYSKPMTALQPGLQTVELLVNTSQWISCFLGLLLNVTSPTQLYSRSYRLWNG